MAHTPGTWHVEQINPDAELTAIGGPIAIVGGEKLGEKVGFIIGTLSDWGPHGIEQTTANADLIAAAPAMYEALQNLENDDGSIPAHAWHMVCAAIAKAEGKA